METKSSTLKGINNRSFYEQLQVSRDADVATIRQSYKKLALKYHPDKNPNDPSAEEKFKIINKAHAVLTNEKRRSIYDNYGTQGLAIAEQIGEENVEMYYLLHSPVVRCISMFCCLATCCCFGCFFCCFCCCNFCCGIWLPKVLKSELNEDLDLSEASRSQRFTRTVSVMHRGTTSVVVVKAPEKSSSGV